MDNIEELKKFKELLDTGVITEEEFNEKKTELLLNDKPDNKAIDNKKTKKEKKPIDSKKKKILVIALVAIIAIIAVAYGVKTSVEASQTAKRNEAVIAHIKPIMNEYGITDYTVDDIEEGYNFFEIYAEGFENLTKAEALECLIALDRISDLDDPCGKEKISFSSANVHPSKDADYYYYRISTAWVNMGKSNYTQPGIYSSYGRECVYACDN